MAVEIRVLGRVDALVDGRAVPLRGSKQRAVLAMLALQANRTVSADDLIDGLWGENPPASAAKNLQLYVSQETGTWTLLSTSPSGVSCIVGAGENWEILPEPNDDPYA